jgi:hypothetical protein
VPICDLPSNPHVPYIVSDGNGGAIIAWFDNRNVKNEIFLQKINSSGVVQWTANGVSVGTVADHSQHGSPNLTTDGAGGAIVAWQDWRKPGGVDVISLYAQRISSSGTIMWGVGGAQVTNQKVSNLSIASDNNGGAIVAWDIYINDSQRDVYIQRMSPSGSQMWAANGVPICTLAHYKGYPVSVADNNGGSIVIWEDNRNTKTNIYAQKFNADGVAQWTNNGVPAIYNTSYSFRFYSIVSDGSDGAYITTKNVSSNTAVVQRINSAGAYQWDPDGTSLGGLYDYPKLISTGSNEMVVTWSKSVGSGDIYAQRYNQAGGGQWGTGVGVSTPQFSAQHSPQIAPGVNGDVIIVWDDYRNDASNSTDIYAQEISMNGKLGMTTGIYEKEPASIDGFILYQNHPNPFSEGTEIRFTINKPERISLKVFGLDGRVISTLVDDIMEPGKYSVWFNPQNLPEGFIYYQMKSGKETSTKYMVHIK